MALPSPPTPSDASPGSPVCFVQLQILPEFIEPASPQQNGRHENMHLVLKRRTTQATSFQHAYSAACVPQLHG